MRRGLKEDESGWSKEFKGGRGVTILLLYDQIRVGRCIGRRVLG